MVTKTKDKLLGEEQLGLEKDQLFFYSNIKVLGLVLVLILAIVLGGGAYQQWTKSHTEEIHSQIYAFNKYHWGPYKKGEKTFDNLKTQFAKDWEKTKGSGQWILLFQEMNTHFREKKMLKEYVGLIEKTASQFDEHTFLYHWMSAHLASGYEDLGQWTKVVEIWEQYLKNGQKFREAHAYLNLGRAFLKLDQKAKAQERFQYIVDYYPNEKESSMAKYYLGKK